MLEKTGELARKKALRIVLLAAVALLALLLIVRFTGRGEKNADTREARMDFIQSLGWACDPESEQAQKVKIPDCSEGSMADYNALMLDAGYDLSPYVGKTVEQYTYEITDYPGYSQTVYLTLYVFDGRVIGGDIHTAALNGFLHELRENKDS